MKKLLTILSCLLVYGICQAADGIIYTYEDPKTGETIQYTKEKGASSFKKIELTNSEAFKLQNYPYTRNKFGYADKIGNHYNCFNLIEGDMLTAELMTNGQWITDVKNKDGSRGVYKFPGNASFIKTTTNGNSFCVRSD